MNTELARDFYFRELEGKIQQDSRVGIFVALLSVVGGLLAFLVRSAWPCRSVWCWASLAFSTTAVVLFFVAVVWVLRATVGYTWSRLPLPDSLLAYYRQLTGYYVDNPSVPGTATADFEEYLLRHLSASASRNAANNLSRSARFYTASCLLVVAVVVAAFAGVCLAANEVLSLVNSKGI